MHRSQTRRKPTQSDVARLAQVSQATVSYVLNYNTAVSVPAETRERILAAAAELGYVPNRAARTLRTNKSLTVASIIPDITNPFYPAFERGTQDIAERYGYDLVIYNTDGIEARERKCLNSIRQGRVDGVIMTNFHLTPADIAPLVAEGIPFVMLGSTEPAWSEAGIDVLAVDNVGWACRAVSYLIERGHTRIGMIAGVAGTPPREQRVAGYRQALLEHGIPAEEKLIRAGDFGEAGGYEAMRDLLKLSPLPTALFAANDLMALGALIALREAGLRVPDDMAVVGYDDIPAARLIDPPLTTVAQFPERLGLRAAEMLFEILRGEVPTAGRLEEMPCELIVRRSA